VTTLGPVVVILLLDAEASAVMSPVITEVSGVAHLDPMQLM